MSLRDLVLRNRSIRRFDESHAVDRETLLELVDIARLTPSAMNKQPLKYVLSCEPERNALIGEHLGWAGYLKGWDGPGVGERPGAYILILGDTEVRDSFGCDHGIAAQTILLGAAERGLGGCMFGSVKREALSKALGIPPRFQILLAVALGRPAEDVRLDEMERGEAGPEGQGREGDIRYWRDDADVHHVPKRTLSEVVLDI